MALLKIDFSNNGYLIVTVVAYIARADIDWGFKPHGLCMMNFSSFFPKKQKTPVLIQCLSVWPGSFLSATNCVTYRPPSGAGTVAGDVVACSPVLAGATLLAVKTVATGGAALATAVTTGKTRIKSIFHRRWWGKYRGMNEMLVLTKLLSTPVDRCTLLSRGRRFHHWDTGRSADMPCHSNRAHRAPHNAIPGTRQCTHRLPWWGYTSPRFGIDTGCCSEVPSSRSRSLQAQKEETSEYSAIMPNKW